MPATASSTVWRWPRRRPWNSGMTKPSETPGSPQPLPLVSIVVPAYNAERFLRPSLDSIVGQSYPEKEILLMDDASTDRTAEIAQSYGGRIAYHRQPRNRGQFGNVDDGIALARGKYIAVYHSDDLYDPEIVAREVAFLEAHHSAGAVFALD